MTIVLDIRYRYGPTDTEQYPICTRDRVVVLTPGRLPMPPTPHVRSMAVEEANFNALLVLESRKVKEMREALERVEYYDHSRRISQSVEGGFALPLTHSAVRELQASLDFCGVLPDPFHHSCELTSAHLPPSKKGSAQNQFAVLSRHIDALLVEHNFAEGVKNQLISQLPRTWERHGDLVVLPRNSFNDPAWKMVSEALWSKVSKALNCCRIAIDRAVSQDDFRSSEALLVLGEDGWVEHVDNGVKYIFDVTKCMFSSGNISEKIRVANFDCSGETIVDLYAGIGYFTLQYLVHTKARFVHACEWNPHAVEALRRGLATNRVEDRCTIHFGDNKLVRMKLKGVADRANLGLLPSSENGWAVACAVLNPATGGWLHIHGNVTSKPIGGGHLGKSTHNKDSPFGVKRVKEEDMDSKVMDSDEEVAGVELAVSPCQLNEGERAPSISSSNTLTPILCTSCASGPAEGTCSEKDRELKQKEKIWRNWADHVALQIGVLLAAENPLCGAEWRVVIGHVEHVKSYAPHIDHIVADIECRPHTLDY